MAEPSGGIRHSRYKIVRTIVSYILFGPLFYFAGRLMYPHWICWVLWGMTGLFAVLTVGEVRKLFRKTLPVVFTPEGMIDTAYSKDGLLIPWDAIRGVTVHRLRINLMTATTTLVLDLEDNEGKRLEHRIDMDTLKGRPSDIADVICFYANEQSGRGMAAEVFNDADARGG